MQPLSTRALALRPLSPLPPCCLSVSLPARRWLPPPDTPAPAPKRRRPPKASTHPAKRPAHKVRPPVKVAAGDPAKIPLKADGTTDAITGATLHPTAVSLAIDALKAAR